MTVFAILDHLVDLFRLAGVVALLLAVVAIRRDVRRALNDKKREDRT